MVKGWRGAGVKWERVESKFNQELTPIWPRPNPILFDPLHCYKNSFTLLEITIGQEKIHGWSAHLFMTGFCALLRGGGVVSICKYFGKEISYVA